MNKAISAHSVGLIITQDENGHWSVWLKNRRVSGPLFNRPEIRKKVTKREARVIVRHNPNSDNPIDFIARRHNHV